MAKKKWDFEPGQSVTLSGHPDNEFFIVVGDGTPNEFSQRQYIVKNETETKTVVWYLLREDKSHGKEVQ